MQGRAGVHKEVYSLLVVAFIDVKIKKDNELKTSIKIMTTPH
jgi:hypothetical protein